MYMEAIAVCLTFRGHYHHWFSINTVTVVIIKRLTLNYLVCLIIRDYRILATFSTIAIIGKLYMSFDIID